MLNYQLWSFWLILARKWRGRHSGVKGSGASNSKSQKFAHQVGLLVIKKILEIVFLQFSGLKFPLFNDCVTVHDNFPNMYVTGDVFNIEFWIFIISIWCQYLLFSVNFVYQFVARLCFEQYNSHLSSTRYYIVTVNHWLTGIRLTMYYRMHLLSFKMFPQLLKLN